MKKFFSLFLLLFFGATFSAQAATFSDIGGKPSRQAVEFLQEKNIVKGYRDGSFGVEKNISRAEFVKILLSTSTLPFENCTETELQNIFPDVKKEDWFGELVCKAKKGGILKGYADGNFYPQNNISVAEASKILSLTQNLKVDMNAKGEWYEKYIAAVSAEKALNKEVFASPAQLLKRGQMAEATWGLMTGTEVGETNETRNIATCEDLNVQMEKFAKRNTGGQQVLYRAFDMAVPMAATMEKSESTIQSGNGAGDFSTTNIQELGVDEADIVKNDGSHIFFARGNDVRILKAYPAENMQEDAKISVEGMYISELFLNGNTLVVLGNSFGNGGIVPYSSAKIAVDSMPWYGGSGKVEVRVFDVTDRKNPKQIRSLSLDGNLVSSRRIGDTLYVVSNNFLPWDVSAWTEKLLPTMADSANTTQNSVAPKCGNIRYFPNFSDRNLMTVAAMNLKNPNEKVNIQNLLGSGNTVYASEKNLYVIQPKTTQTFVDENGIAEYKWDESSQIFRFSLNGTAVSQNGSALISGRVLNQYAMSEFEENFRIATQSGNAWGAEKSNNRVTILDKNLQKTGEIQKIALGEDIKSVRFMGKKGFVVTFKTVDPLFVLDMDPKNPKILGELKIPGWSDYLHPLDENHLLGFGKEVDESVDADKVHSDNAIYYTAVKGMKLSIFDVSDFKNPKEIQKVVIGDRGTESEILQNPKALFFDSNQKLVGFPVEIQKIVNGKIGIDAEMKSIFQGIQIYSFDYEKGFLLKGQATHFLSNASNFWDQNFRASRVVRLGENFYTLSKGIVKAWDGNLKEKKSVSFMKDLSCEEIFDAQNCEARNDCKAEYMQPWCETGKICIQTMQFSQCVKK